MASWLLRSKQTIHSNAYPYRSHGNSHMQTLCSYISIRCFSWFQEAAATSSRSAQQQDDDSKKKVTVCILGPPNAGKSTLFNRLLAKEHLYALNTAKKKNKKSKPQQQQHKRGRAIVHDIAGTTRDRRLAAARISDIDFDLWDTAGILQQREQERVDAGNSRKSSSRSSSLPQQVLPQHQPNHHSIDTSIQLSHTQEAAAASDLVWLVVDGRLCGGGVPHDVMTTARWLRRLPQESSRQRRVQVLANKLLEKTSLSLEEEEEQDEFLQALEDQLGFGPAVPISALLGHGMADLAVTLLEVAGGPSAEEEEQKEDENDEDRKLQLVIMGRQNVGKSTLLNALAQSDRAVTGPMAGLTRDAVAVDIPDTPVRAVDTAGVVKGSNSKVDSSKKQNDDEDSLQQLAMEDAMNSMKVADVVVLVLEATAGFVQATELKLADRILAEGRALVIVVNKMDCIEFSDNYRHVDLVQQVRDQLEDRYPGLRNTPILAVSSVNGTNVERVLPVVYESQKRWNQVISTSKLNQWCRDLQDTTTPTQSNIRIKYMIQTKGRPPTFLLFCNTEKVSENITNHWKRKLQETFGFYGMDLRFQIRQSANPFTARLPKKRSGSGLGGHEARKKRKLRALADTFKGCTTKEEGRAKMLAATRHKHRRKKKKRQ